ncbi:winged helix-turn-helix domain-containing tetratricopeptide repeat protein [Jannaschia seohaensis]|uniref:DNA-binding winged helix-turn-helix (WHTH) domain-containing protein n=1 Tax=Jannaschia seohaensis TaxID=475081 RepID=A0A2Y9C986_9RHOB|nr:winged helix-turn-helix domain-containing protein [Jannaschia seohaensis]PWJ10323.1 DNA-binding winged helix-turn-helix (wHTH) protein [Jannaschia seohaensis]SSA51723.1 DNA-binding winged helix-turn-helix (wHTH) domain-containing protein [Jannaschia seohaensis]
MIYRFDDLELDTSRSVLQRGAEEIRLEPRAFALLRVLVENRDRVVSKDELVEKVWSGRFISDDAISTAMKSVRRALNDSGASQSAIRTLRGRGFRFIAPVRVMAPSQASDAAQDASAPLKDEDGRPSIAVLPFRLLGASEGQTAIADAIPAELITSLSRLRWLKVFARGSCFKFRDDIVNFESIRSGLGANYCLCGVVEVFGRKLVITVELNDTRSETIVWSDRFQGKIDDVYEMRAKIATSVVAALEIYIPYHEAENARLRSPLCLNSWALYHLGLQHMYRFNKADNAAATNLFDQALALDPTFARAQAARSFTSFQNAFLNYTPNRAADILDARRFAEKSVEIDPHDPMGNFTLARAHWLEGSPENGIGWLDRAIKISPNFSHGHYARGWTDIMGGRSTNALEYVGAAIELSPLDPFLYAMLATRAFAHLIDGNTSKAATWAEHAARAPGAHYLIGLIAAVAHQMNGDQKSASLWAQRAKSRRPGASTERFFNAFPFSDTALRRSISDALNAAGIE